MTGTRYLGAVAIAVFMSAGWMRADLTAAKAQPKLEKRARMALDNAEKMLSSANKSYKAGDWEKTVAALDEIRDSVELAYDSLKETGKNPRKKPKHFKHAEIKTRELLRELEDFRLRMSLEERESMVPLQRYIERVHDDLLEGIMGTGQWTAK